MQTPVTPGNPFDPITILDMASKIGFPLIFIVGQMREWWYVKPHVEMLTARLKEMAVQLETSENHAERATDIAESAQEIAREALELSRSIEEGIRSIEAQLAELLKQAQAGEKDG